MSLIVSFELQYLVGKVVRHAIFQVLAAFAVGFCTVSLGGSLGHAGEYTKAQVLLFDTPHLSNIRSTGSLRYDFDQRGTEVVGFSDSVELFITKIHEDGSKNLRVDFLTGRRRLPFSPVEGYRGNPLVMLFLQHDVVAMARELGGQPNYFRNRLRDALAKGGQIENFILSHGGQDLEAVRVTLTPFLGDRYRENFGAHENKTYEFVFAEDLPGGIYQIRTSVPGLGEAPPVLEETVTLRSGGA